MNYEYLKDCWKAPDLTEDEKELYAWLRLNQENFTTVIKDEQTGEVYPKWAIADIAEFAASNGFDYQLVIKHISPLTVSGRFVSQVARFQVFQLEVALEQIGELKKKRAYKPELDLSKQWEHLVNRQIIDGSEFADA